MSHYRRAYIPGATYFFTVVTYRRRPILCDDPVRSALRDAVKTVQSRHPFTIDAWVLLPDHLHTIWTLPPGDADCALRWSSIKRRVSLACAGLYHRTDWMTASKSKHRESTFWQRRYWEHCINSESDYARHRDYIAINPLKHGLVSRVQDWPFSTFHRDVARGIYPLDWAGCAGTAELASGGEPA
ncbi:transposase [Methylobacter sp. Wu8]|uniref:Putative transposase n=1 Tax=Methylobacter tundripaludum TaxID=173365 RepID=A0A2S6H008_9GAMM|nr:transposase [Methylobacter tundripaludum]MCF7965365.1 transposase [Methylobacter tundripaludum]MCK9638017.1 transposase [Methylobacter tundripaludum]PPK70815.1 putative transposase [Methylobacter tundripaludum]